MLLKIKELITGVFKPEESLKVPADAVICFHCDGAGDEDFYMNCPACNGDGFIEKDKVDERREKLFPKKGTKKIL